MKYTKAFTDEEGETHFKDVEIKLESVDFAPPAPPINLSSYNPATRYAFCARDYRVLNERQKNLKIK